MAEAAETASRWASLGRRGALFLSFLLVIALAASIWAAASTPAGSIASRSVPAAVSATPKANEDLTLYRTIVDRVAAGENYYRAAADELRTNDYPLKPFLAFRLPTLAVVSAMLGRPLMIALQFALFVAMVWAWWVRLDGQFAENRRRVSGAMLAAAGVAVAFSGRYVDLHEIWAGSLIALSLALHRPNRWMASVIVAALALAIRELALPYVLLMAGMAPYRRRWREFVAWAAVVILFALAMIWHANQVAQVVLPSDPGSPSWATLGGWAGFLRTYHLAGPLRWLPAEVAAPLIILALFGWASWKSQTGLAATLLYAGYGLAFMLFGRANNFYWGLMVAPAFLVGLAFVPRAISDLASAARRRTA